MAQHQHDPDANELWLYYQSVINWVKTIFSKYRKEMWRFRSTSLSAKHKL
jgi:hypothetical protein